MARRWPSLGRVERNSTEAVGTTALTSLAVTGPTALNGGSVATTADQTYTGAVTLGADMTLTGVGVTLSSTVQSPTIAHSLTVNDSDTTILAGRSARRQSAFHGGDGCGGHTALNGGAITTTGTQTYSGPVTLGADATLAGAG